jgi:hypothetical protein
MAAAARSCARRGLRRRTCPSATGLAQPNAEVLLSCSARPGARTCSKLERAGVLTAAGSPLNYPREGTLPMAGKR